MKRLVICATKDENGVVTEIGYPANWGKVSRQVAINQINSGTFSYYTQDYDGKEADIEVFNENFLKTDPDSTIKNNLDNLKDCSL